MLNEETIAPNHSDPIGTDLDAEDLTDSEASDDDRNHKHRRRESSPRPPHSNDQNATALLEDSSQPNKKQRIKPFDPKRRFRPNNNNQFRGRPKFRNNNNNNNNQGIHWGAQPDPRFNMGPVPPLEMHDLALVAGPGALMGGPGPYGFMVDPVHMGVLEHHHMGMPRQRCADFEERGFCLRGDMCPMEHGVNRIVVEDVQSLSQLKLLGPGPKPVMPVKDSLRPNGVLPSIISAPDADVYDPDQPLWNNNNNNNNITGPKPDPLAIGGTSDDPNSSVWGRINSKTNPNPNLNQGFVNKKENLPKATRTLYICGIPQKDNRVESLFSHFKKFGTVVDIYVPANSEKAFVQFSKKEEAEKALVAPDAVMGNRFIKLLWANRDRISDDNNYHSKGKGNFVNTAGGTSSMVNGGTKVVPVVAPKVVLEKEQMESPVLKKTESMELLEELRKKQEDLKRKRDEFRKQLAKLEKQTSLSKKMESPVMKKKGTKDLVSPSSFKPNRFKIDNRPVQFRVLSLPHELSNVSVLKEHFSQFGELASITLEKEENEKEALVTYTEPKTAERAYSSAKSFKGHNLIFKWVLPTKNTHTNAKNTHTGTNASTSALNEENSKMGTTSPPVQVELEKSGPPVQAELERSRSPVNGAQRVVNSGTVHD